MFDGNFWLFESSVPFGLYAQPEVDFWQSGAKPWPSHPVFSLSLSVLTKRVILLNTQYAFASATSLQKYLRKRQFRNWTDCWSWKDNALERLRTSVLKNCLESSVTRVLLSSLWARPSRNAPVLSRELSWVMKSINTRTYLKEHWWPSLGLTSGFTRIICFRSTAVFEVAESDC